MEIDYLYQQEEFDSVSPWKRKRSKSRDAYCVNRDLDIATKRAALKASPAVVSLVFYKGSKKMFAGSGTIIQCDEVNGMYTSTILTSTTLLRSSTESDAIPDDIKVNVYLPDGKLFKGRVSGYDIYFGIATIDMTSDEPLPAATLRPLDDSNSICPSEMTCPRDEDPEVASKSFQLIRHSNLFKLQPGDMVVAIGRSYGGTHELMAAPGTFSLASYKLDCGELFKSTCIISQTAFGGPLINRYGEVIGVNFYDKSCTPFLPVNIVSKCLRRIRKSWKSCRPWLGMELSNLYAASVGKLEKVISKFSISKGVLVEEVIKGSPAEQAGILCGDVIVQCGEKDVQSFLKFYDMIWKKVGKTVEVVVMRESSAAHLILKVLVDETSPDKLNRWPVPETFKASVL